jgi:conserved oligomeric Golgi complex subunit 3
VFLCVQALRGGSDQVKRVSSPLHGDLFLVRHLLILREQLIPFEIRLQTVEKHLDWTGTSAAITNLVHNTRMMLRFDAGNAFLQLAWDGIPGMQETEIDAKRDLDNVLKSACSSMKQNAIKGLLGPLDSFLAKVTAFVGEIPIAAPGDSKLNLSENASFKSLKNQAFTRPDRIKEMLDTAVVSISKSTDDLRTTLQLYVENAVARAILLKPIQQEAELSKRRMETVLDACIDGSVPESQQLYSALENIFTTISSELTH